MQNMEKKENPTNNVTLFQNVAGHTSSKRVSGILCILTGGVLLGYTILFGIHSKTAVDFSDITNAISIFFWAGSALLGVSVAEYFGKFNPFKK
jgi:hypothetical protein